MTDNRNPRDQNTGGYGGPNGNRGGQGNRPNGPHRQGGGQGYRPNDPHRQGGGQGKGTGYQNGHGGGSHQGNGHQQGHAAWYTPSLKGTNLGYLFNRLLYTDESESREYTGAADTNNLIQPRLDWLCKDPELQLSRAQAWLAPPEGLATDVIELETQYPGLYIGLGYQHGLEDSKADIKNGFFFDHTSGLPVVPASSVKGKLRSAFEEMPEYTLFVLQQTACFAAADMHTVKALLNELFEGEDEREQPLAMPLRTVFFDAYPCACGKDGLLGFDSITPHDREGLKEPNTIRMLKVKGGVRWRFPFRFAAMEPARRQALVQVFQQILMDWGIGAKTNVGYGTLVQR